MRWAELRNPAPLYSTYYSTNCLCDYASFFIADTHILCITKAISVCKQYLITFVGIYVPHLQNCSPSLSDLVIRHIVITAAMFITSLIVIIELEYTVHTG